MSDPRTRFYLRVVFAGLLAAAAALKAYLPGLSVEDIIDVLASAVVAAGAYAGVGAATPLEPSVGRTPAPPAETTQTK